MAVPRILLVDNSTMRSPFLLELLQEAGRVVQFELGAEAMAAVKGGMGVDVAVLNYRLSLTPLIQAIRQQHPKAKIVAYGAPRADPPLGVDTYLSKPIIGTELGMAVEKLLAKSGRH